MPAVELQPRQGLAHVAAKLWAGQDVTVAVFAGGNHAQGQWTVAVGQWLQAQYPAAKLTVINSPIDGGLRGSGLSVFRLGRDVLSHRPDLLIVDFVSQRRRRLRTRGGALRCPGHQPGPASGPVGPRRQADPPGDRRRDRRPAEPARVPLEIEPLWVRTWTTRCGRVTMPPAPTRRPPVPRPTSASPSAPGRRASPSRCGCSGRSPPGRSPRRACPADPSPRRRSARPDRQRTA